MQGNNTKAQLWEASNDLDRKKFAIGKSFGDLIQVVLMKLFRLSTAYRLASKKGVIMSTSDIAIELLTLLFNEAIVFQDNRNKQYKWSIFDPNKDMLEYVKSTIEELKTTVTKTKKKTH